MKIKEMINIKMIKEVINKNYFDGDIFIKKMKNVKNKTLVRK